MRFNSRSHTVIATLSLCCLIVFLKLGHTEIQPWDEGLYAIRARSILQFGAFWDQAQYAVGGMYSATYPPLTVWFMSLFMKIFGQNSALAVRLYPALCSCASVVIIHFLARRIVSWEMSLVASALLAGTTVWNSYARQGMLDVPLMMYCLLALLAMIKIVEAKQRNTILIWTGVFALAFAASLLTKIVISFLPVLFIIPYLRGERTDRKKYLFAAILLGLCLAMPWYISMSLRHGSEFTGAFMVPHMYSAVENNTRRLGIFYYINQLFIANPVFLFAFVFVILFLLRRVNRPARYLYFEHSLILWFVAVFTVFSISPTKMPHYTVYLVPPAVLLAARGYEEIAERFASHRLVWTALSAVVVLMIWAVAPQIRTSMHTIFLGGEGNFSGYFFLVCTITIFILGWMMPSRRVIDAVIGMFYWSSIVLPIILLLRVGWLNYTEPARLYCGAVETGNFLKRSGADSFAYLFHEYNQSDKYNPQLGWYTDGWSNGLLPGKKIHSLSMPRDFVDYQVLAKLESMPDEIVVYYTIDFNNSSTAAVLRELRRTRGAPMLVTNKYIIFGQKRFDREFRQAL